ncbi:AKT-interacting protein [Nymphon striatum]|nr:AKT-interacting protein [Nymphon striatum]
MESDRFTKSMPISSGTSSKKIVSSVMKHNKQPSGSDYNTGVSDNIVQFYQPFILEYTLMNEYKQLQNQNLPGIYVVPSAKSPLRWFGVMFIRQGLYQDGVFKFTLQVPETYPDCDTPSIIFQPSIFHPLVDAETGKMDVKRSFPNWRRNKHQLWHILQFARRAFYKIDSSLPLNPEASVFFEKDIELYKRKVSESLALSKENLYEPQDPDDPHAITFNKWEPTIHGEFLQKIKTQVYKDKETDLGKSSQSSGLSWVKPDSMKIFSKPIS